MEGIGGNLANIKMNHWHSWEALPPLESAQTVLQKYTLYTVLYKKCTPDSRVALLI